MRYYFCALLINALQIVTIAIPIITNPTNTKAQIATGGQIHNNIKNTITIRHPIFFSSV
jgi:hypothetical protein